MLRAEVKAGTPLGKMASEILAAGHLIGDDVVNEMLVHRLSQPDCEMGFLLDGYPRTVPQAKFLDEYLKDHGYPQPTVFFMSTPVSVLIERLSARRQCPVCKRIYNLLFQPPKRTGVCDDDGAKLIRRSDDHPDTIKARLDEYNRLTSPVLAYYGQGDFYAVKANRPPAEVFRDIRGIIESKLNGRGTSA